MLTHICLVFGGLLVVPFVSGLTGDAICDYIAQNMLCADDPCNCGEPDLNCDVCASGGCSKCQDGYFRNEYDEKCINCDVIDDCSHCTDNTGCQDCYSGCQPKFNSCGVKYCDCNGVTPSPTLQPTVDGSDTPGVQVAFTDYLTATNPGSVGDWFTDDAVICWGDYPCDNGANLLIFAGICNEGTISTVGDNVYLAGRNIWTFYRSCEERHLGLFWMKGMAAFIFNDLGLIERAYVNFDCYEDELHDKFEQFLDIYNLTLPNP